MASPQELRLMFGKSWCEKAVEAGRRWLRRKPTDTFTQEEVGKIVVLEAAHVAVEALAHEIAHEPVHV